MGKIKSLLLSVGIMMLFFILFHSSVSAQSTIENQILDELIGYKFKHIVVNTDLSDTRIPIIIGLHWKGSTPNEFSKFLTGFDFPVRLILVQGQYPSYQGYFSFFRIIPNSYYTLPKDEKMELLLTEGEKRSKFIKSIISKYKPGKKPVIIGASQGEDLAYVIGVRCNNLISLSCPLFTTLDNRIIKPQIKPTQKSLARIEIFHGIENNIVPIERVKQYFQLLKDNNYDVNLHVYKDVSHDIPDEMIIGFNKLITKYLCGVLREGIINTI
ncbi:alpha/beta hydrolase [Galbibacter pacificus]|uniref:Phospholipase/carboxylesterase/thioesterase domain-containing protein n=1 Tax=Galbibacter pacificus TaxID=2996052 RepID=A0ABT6FR14_9FLAO|nr:hypothetical protein [Galbibacter pacificus]MDG3581828.1 hypothetical protein [Galbibacter pacificus]MDG3585698.1 hypothetical protein [Galbibacter pacificus]